MLGERRKHSEGSCLSKVIFLPSLLCDDGKSFFGGEREKSKLSVAHEAPSRILSHFGRLKVERRVGFHYHSVSMHALSALKTFL